MMTLKRTLVCLLMGFFLATSVQADELARSFLNGVTYYNSENFEAAIAEFSKIVDSGVKNGKLFYNIGNAYLKNGDIGNAVLWYERALQLMPNDPDLNFNHKYALTLVKDEKEDSRWPIFRVLFFWQHLLSSATVQWAALILNFAFWLFWALQSIWPKRNFKPTSYMILVLTLIFTLTALYNHYTRIHIKQAVILSDKVSIRSGLTGDSTELFLLHAGTKVKIDKDNKEFYKIYFSEGKIGWLKKSEVGII